MDGNKPQVTVEQVNAAVAEAGGIEQPRELTEKQKEKLNKQLNNYWKGMITRQEAVEMVNEALRNEQEKNRMLFIQLKTITKMLTTKGICTLEELDNLSKPIVKELYGLPDELANVDKKEEATETDTDLRDLRKAGHEKG